MNKVKHNHISLELLLRKIFEKQIMIKFNHSDNLRDLSATKNTGRVDLKLKSKQKNNLK